MQSFVFMFERKFSPFFSVRAQYFVSIQVVMTDRIKHKHSLACEDMVLLRKSIYF